MSYIKDYKFQLKKELKNKKILIHFKASTELVDLFNRAIIREYKEEALYGVKEPVMRAKIKRPVFNNLNFRGGEGVFLFQQDLVEKNWNANLEFENAQSASRFIKAIPDIISIIASFFEKYDKVK